MRNTSLTVSVLIVLCFAIFPSLGIRAQTYQIPVSITQKEVTKKGKKILKTNEFPLHNQLVLGFDSQSSAQRFIEKVNKGDIIPTEYESYSRSSAVTDNSGKAYLSILPNGRIVWINSTNSRAQLYPIINGECIIVDEQVFDSDITEMEEVRIKGENMGQGADSISSIIIGKDIVRPKTPFKIESIFAKDNYRFGMTPIFICIENPSDTLCKYRPFLKQGKDYNDTQHRRLEYDMMKHDSLAHPSSMSDKFLHNHKADTLWYHWHVRKKNPNLHYRVLADYWCEDYNGIIYRDTVQIDHGKNMNKLRFLDINLDSMKTGIDTTRYHIDGKIERRNVNLKLNFDFVWSKNYLKENSVQNDETIQRLVTEFGGAYYDEQTYMDGQSVIATGVASPDGRVVGNRKLAHERAQTIAALLKEKIPALTFSPICRDSIAPWRAVADTLLALGDTVRANELYSICNTYHDMEQQWLAVQKNPILDYKNYLKDEIMPRFCVVSFSYAYIVSRTLNYSEVVQKYEKDDRFRNRATKEHYQYEYLFHYLRNRIPELEKQSKMAYENLKEYEQENEYNRPWPLAAYVYANCLLKSGRTDLDDEPYEGILWPFLRKDIPPLNQDSVRVMREHQFRQYWNDEAIVTTMVAMYFQSLDILKAKWVAKNYLNHRKKKYESFMTFLNAYDNESNPKVIKAVAATSKFNEAVIYAAQDEKKNRKIAEAYFKRAISILDDNAFRDDHRAYYLKANLKYRLYGPNNGQVALLDPFFLANDTVGKSKEEIEEDLKWDYKDFQLDSVAANKEGSLLDFKTWKRRKEYGIDMLKACAMHPEYLEELKWDGYFSDSYRKAFFYIWRKKQEGFTEDQIKREWRKFLEKEKI